MLEARNVLQLLNRNPWAEMILAHMSHHTSKSDAMATAKGAIWPAAQFRTFYETGHLGRGQLYVLGRGIHDVVIILMSRAFVSS